ncbi:F-box domain-containing protein [Mycena venus]|uniref:F-box domain-containing protein n=1 Tax=Mycena venus TaxID=2733690 RepID=A0A8H6X5D9_9AGAR|nr:F-box domain-containing protein [Mycena venus]
MWRLGSLNTVAAFTFYEVTPHHSRLRSQQRQSTSYFKDPSGLDSSWLKSTYPVLTLPPEIITEIFVAFLPNYPDFPSLRGIFSPLLFCQICQKWRAIALSTPILWRAICVDLTRGDSDRKIAADLQQLKTWLKRSGDCPLSLGLTHARKVTHRLVPQFLRAIVAHCQRWEHVDLLIPFEYMDLIRGEMPLLRNLTFGPSNFPHGRARFPHLFSSAAQLQSVILTRNFFKSIMTLPWKQLTHLEADCLYEQECVDIFREVPLLVAGIFRVCQHPGRSDISLGPAISPHDHLRNLILDADEEAAIPPRLSMLLDCLTLPTLCTLQVAGPCITLESVAAFITRSQCYLEHLCIAGTSLSESAYRAALPPFGTFTLEPYSQQLQ